MVAFDVGCKAIAVSCGGHFLVPASLSRTLYPAAWRWGYSPGGFIAMRFAFLLVINFRTDLVLSVNSRGPLGRECCRLVAGCLLLWAWHVCAK